MKFLKLLLLPVIVMSQGLGTAGDDIDGAISLRPRYFPESFRLEQRSGGKKRTRRGHHRIHRTSTRAFAMVARPPQGGTASGDPGGDVPPPPPLVVAVVPPPSMSSQEIVVTPPPGTPARGLPYHVIINGENGTPDQDYCLYRRPDGTLVKNSVYPNPSREVIRLRFGTSQSLTIDLPHPDPLHLLRWLPRIGINYFARPDSRSVWIAAAVRDSGLDFLFPADPHLAVGRLTPLLPLLAWHQCTQALRHQLYEGLTGISGALVAGERNEIVVTTDDIHRIVQALLADPRFAIQRCSAS